MPPILIIDIQFFTETGEIIKKNFQIPSKLDMADQFWVDKDEDDDKEIPNSKYELFAQIGFDAKNVRDMTYYPIIKKCHKK